MVSIYINASWIALKCACGFVFKGVLTNYSLFTMLQRKPKGDSIHSASYRGGPSENVQMPELPKQLEGKFVKGQMYKYQDSLPKLPVPPLEQTLKKYITGVKVRI